MFTLQLGSYWLFVQLTNSPPAFFYLLGKKCGLSWRWLRRARRFLEGHFHFIFPVIGRSYKRGKYRPPLFWNKVISHFRPGLLTSVLLDILTEAIWVSLWMWTVIHNIRECHLHHHIFLYRKQWHDWVWVWESKWLTCDLEMEVMVHPSRSISLFQSIEHIFALHKVSIFLWQVWNCSKSYERYNLPF